MYSLRKGARGCPGMSEGKRELWGWGLRCGKKAKLSLRPQSNLTAGWQWGAHCPLGICTDPLHATWVPQTLTELLTDKEAFPVCTAVTLHQPRECTADWLRLWAQMEEFSACPRARSGARITHQLTLQYNLLTECCFSQGGFHHLLELVKSFTGQDRVHRSPPV